MDGWIKKRLYSVPIFSRSRSSLNAVTTDRHRRHQLDKIRSVLLSPISYQEIRVCGPAALPRNGICSLSVVVMLFSIHCSRVSECTFIIIIKTFLFSFFLYFLAGTINMECMSLRRERTLESSKITTNNNLS